MASADQGHKGAFPVQADIAKFLKTLGKHDDVARAADIPSSTYNKWHQSDASKMSAEHLLRVVLAVHREREFYDWLREFSRPKAERGTLSGSSEGKGTRRAAR